MESTSIIAMLIFQCNNEYTELATIFSSVDLADGPLTAITLSQKSKYDMTCWSPDVEEERDMLIEKV